jgi:hypothetical protein
LALAGVDLQHGRAARRPHFEQPQSGARARRLCLGLAQLRARNLKPGGGGIASVAAVDHLLLGNRARIGDMA